MLRPEEKKKNLWNEWMTFCYLLNSHKNGYLFSIMKSSLKTCWNIWMIKIGENCKMSHYKITTNWISTKYVFLIRVRKNEKNREMSEWQFWIPENFRLLLLKWENHIIFDTMLFSDSDTSIYWSSSYNSIFRDKRNHTSHTLFHTFMK